MQPFEKPVVQYFQKANQFTHARAFALAQADRNLARLQNDKSITYVTFIQGVQPQSQIIAFKTLTPFTLDDTPQSEQNQAI